jgi:PIN domain nuclease of toxin-antitoxin system
VRVLLDTHVWLWSRLAPGKLSGPAKRVLLNPDSELWLSPISVWETLLLIEKGRVVVDSPPGAWVSAALRTVPLLDCPLNHEVALASRSIQLEHDDPADRFLVATALVFDLTLLTADTRLLACSAISTLAAA